MIAIGTRAPAAVLTRPGAGRVDLESEFARGPVLLAFFKGKCPTSPLVMPKVPRFVDAYPRLAVWAVSQDNPERTQAFMDQHAPDVAVLVDHPCLELSKACDLEAVPVLMLVLGGIVTEAMVGWDRETCRKLSRACAQATGAPYDEISEDGDGPDWQAGCISASL